MSFTKWQMKKKDEDTLEMLYEEAPELENLLKSTEISVMF